jgi:hypothetical protein
MEEILAQLDGQTVLSLNKKIRYDVEVLPNQCVKVSHPGRKVPAILTCEIIERVYKAASSGMQVNIKNADNIMGDARDRNASAIFALVKAMHELSVARSS